MNVNPLIIAALTPLGMPVEPDIYTGDATEYITFNYSDERPVVYADDVDITDETSVQVHYFTKGNPQANKKAIRKALRNAGFSIVDTAQYYEDDTGYTHVIVTVNIEGIIDD